VAEMDKMLGVSAYTLPGDIYEGVDYSTSAIETMVHVIVHKDFPEDLAYEIVRVVAENFEGYKDLISQMARTPVDGLAYDAGIPFHPGALKYYEEQGWIK